MHHLAHWLQSPKPLYWMEPGERVSDVMNGGRSESFGIRSLQVDPAAKRLTRQTGAGTAHPAPDPISQVVNFSQVVN
jgi:hypothetical protein